jgi:hypothetical protein
MRTAIVIYICVVRYVTADAIAIGKARNIAKFRSTLIFNRNIRE